MAHHLASSGNVYLGIETTEVGYASSHKLVPVGDELKRKRFTILAGWQARAINNDDPLPKYLSASGMKKGAILYGLSAAIKTEGPVVLVEGAVDAWRLHTNAVALFGKSISQAQVKLILRYFANRPVVIALDNDAMDDAARVREKIISGRLIAGDDSSVFIARLPRGRKDPGECTHKEIWNAVNKAVGA